MKKVFGIIAVLVLVATIAWSAEDWKLTWTSIASSTSTYPSTYYNANYGSSPNGIPTEDAKSLMLICVTDSTASATFKYYYDTQTASGTVVMNGVPASSNSGRTIPIAGHHVKIEATNLNTTSATTPYCNATIAK